MPLFNAPTPLAIDNSVPMSSSTATAPSSSAAETIDQAIRRKGWTSAGIQLDMTPYLVHGTTNASGIATFYVTDNGLSSGNAVFSSIFTDGLLAVPIGTSSNYQVVSVTPSGDLKSVAINVNQLGSVVLGLVNVTSAASGVETKGIVWGTYVG